MNGFRIIIPIIIIVSLNAQQSGTGQGRLGGSGFFFNNLSFDWSDLNKNLQISGKLKTLEFGFKQVGLAYKQGKKQQTLDMEFQGPEVIISGLEIQANSHSPNWIAKTKSRYQQQRQEPAVKGVSIIAAAVDSFASSFGRNPESYDELVIKNYIRLDKYPFDQKKWQFAMPTPNKIIKQKIPCYCIYSLFYI